MKVYGTHNVEVIGKFIIQHNRGISFLVKITLYCYNSEFYDAVIGLHVTSIKKISNILRIIVCLFLVSWLRLRPRRGWENNLRIDLKKENVTTIG
jgi:hypothetical protein